MLPVKKTSKSRTRTRRSHHRLGQCGYVNEKITLKLAEEADS
ncbi:MAG: 50S ribosomal protein L32 [Planctomycetota bacterium]|jgi:ribosomal protein L32